MEHPADIGKQAVGATSLLPSLSAEPRLPVQDNRDWHPEHRAVDLDELDESHLIRGYD